MRACVTINDVIRRFYDTFSEVYEVYLNEELDFEESLGDNNFEFKDIDEAGELINSSSINKVERKCLNLSGVNDPMYLTSKFEFVDSDNFFDFLYSTMAFEIFAKTAIKYKSAIEDFHNLMTFFKEHGIEVDLVSVEHNNSKPATLFFLSREKCKLNNLRFLSNYEKIWDDYQIVITAEPYIIENKRPRRKLLKIKTPQNAHLSQGIAVDNLQEALKILKNGDSNIIANK